MSALSKTWAGYLVMENTALINVIIVRGIDLSQIQRDVVCWDTWVWHVLEFRTSSDDQEDQVEDVENNYNQEEDLHALEK